MTQPEFAVRDNLRQGNFPLAFHNRVVARYRLRQRETPDDISQAQFAV